jgi:predicted RNA-binding protein YlxR (DUF448 family)
VRIAAVPDGGRASRAAIDPRGTLPGRGAYLCRADAAQAPAPKPECLRLAERNRGIARTLRRAVTLDVECLESEDR